LKPLSLRRYHEVDDTMAKRNFRSGRIGEEIRRIISDLLLRGMIKDPRLSGIISISSVKASSDGAYATVYFTKLGGDAFSGPTEAEKGELIDAFSKASGYIRHEIGSKLGIKYAPELRFVYDESELFGRHIEQIIDEIDIPPEEKPANTLTELANVIMESETVRIFPHESTDGDTLGSSVALCLALKSLGKDASVVINDKIPDNIAFIVNECTVDASGWLSGEDGSGYFDEEFDLGVLMDVGETDRLHRRDEIFEMARTTMCIDHHISSKAIYDYNLIDISAAATSEIIYDLINELQAEITHAIAEAIYVGLITDTGRFQFSNTTPRSLNIAADLLGHGVNPNHVSTEVYHSMRLQKLYLENEVMNTTVSIKGGKGLVAYLTKAMLVETGAMEEETEGLAEKLRSFRGVEVSVFLRETDDGRTKASMRSKSYYDVAALAQKFGGGGHIRAAGFTSAETTEQVREKIVKILEDTL